MALHDAVRLLTDVIGALHLFRDLLSGGDPTVRGNQPDLFPLARLLAALRDAYLTLIGR